MPKTEPNPKPLTPAQFALIEAVQSLRAKNGIRPSYEELMGAVGLTKTRVVERVKKLCERGYLSRVAGEYRSLTITAKGRKALREKAGR